MSITGPRYPDIAFKPLNVISMYYGFQYGCKKSF